MRLRTVSPQSPGWRRVRQGRGFSYLSESGDPLPTEQRERAKALVIPPAWTDVWICPDEKGHLQAVGTDDAGRRQYLYHPEWRRKRDEAKFERAMELGRQLPRVRATVRSELGGDPQDVSTVLAVAIRLLDLGCFRLGSENSAEEFGSFGLTTLLVGHVGKDGDARCFEFVGKGGVEHTIVISDDEVVRAVDRLVSRRRRESRLLVVRDERQKRAVTATDINERIRDLFTIDATAKDFRTWKATTTVAAALASVERESTSRGRARQVRDAVAEAADLLGNTTTVARTSYIDPRVIDLFEDGHTINAVRSENGLDRAVVRLLS